MQRERGPMKRGGYTGSPVPAVSFKVLRTPRLRTAGTIARRTIDSLVCGRCTRGTGRSEAINEKQGRHCMPGRDEEARVCTTSASVWYVDTCSRSKARSTGAVWTSKGGRRVSVRYN